MEGINMVYVVLDYKVEDYAKERHEYNFKYFCYRYCLNDYLGK